MYVLKMKDKLNINKIKIFYFIENNILLCYNCNMINIKGKNMKNNIKKNKRDKFSIITKIIASILAMAMIFSIAGTLIYYLSMK